MSSKPRRSRVIVLALGLVLLTAMVISAGTATAAPTYKPMLTGKEWVAITGWPLSATVGAKIFLKGGNAVDAAGAMMIAECVHNNGVGFGGEAQILVYDPYRCKVFGINGMGVAPTGATPEFFLDQGMAYPPNYGPLAATTPGVPGGLMVMLAEFGTMSLKEVLEPCIDMADGYPIGGRRQGAIAQKAKQDWYKKWKYSREVFVPPPEEGEIFVQRNLANTFRKLVAAEEEALAAGKSRKEAIMAAYDRFYKGDIAVEFVRGSQEEGGLHTLEDLANWKCYIEEPVMTTYHGIEVYKLTTWTQGPVLLQMLNLLEGIDLEAMGHNSLEYLHTLYQVMNLAYADRDFYYGDPYVPPEEPIKGLLSKEYAAERRKLIDPTRNRPDIGPGDPYPYQGEKNPYLKWVKTHWGTKTAAVPFVAEDWVVGTTSVQAADITGWVVSITPSGAWPPAVLAGKTGVPMSQRMQSFVVDPAMNPYNVVQPGARPRVTLTPMLSLKDGHFYMSASKPGGDMQDQSILMVFLNVVHFGMNIQEAVESPKFRSYGMYSSFGTHTKNPGRILLDSRIPQEVVDGLKAKGYDVVIATPGEFDRPGGELPGNVTAILSDWEHQTLMGGASIGSERYGISW